MLCFYWFNLSCVCVYRSYVVLLHNFPRLWEVWALTNMLNPTLSLCVVPSQWLSWFHLSELLYIFSCPIFYIQLYDVGFLIAEGHRFVYNFLHPLHLNTVGKRSHWQSYPSAYFYRLFSSSWWNMKMRSGTMDIWQMESQEHKAYAYMKQLLRTFMCSRKGCPHFDIWYGMPGKCSKWLVVGECHAFCVLIFLYMLKKM